VTASPLAGPVGTGAGPDAGVDADVVVVGAGLAGLTCARDLRRAGVRTIVLEARARLGGRAWTDPRALAGLPFEMGGMYVDPGHRAVTGLLRDYGLSLTPTRPPRTVSWYTRGRLRVGGPPVPLDELVGLERAVRAWQDAAHEAAAGRTVPGSIEDHFLGTDPGPHTRDLLAAFFGEQAAGHWSQAAMQSLAADLAGSGASVVAWITAASLSPTVEGGLGRLVARLGQDAGPIALRTFVTHIGHDSDAATVATRDRSWRARVVVLATPLNTWRDLDVQPDWPGPARRLIDRGHAGAGYKLGVLATGTIPDYGLARLPGVNLVRSVERHRDGTTTLAVFGEDRAAVDPGDLPAVTSMLQPLIPDITALAATTHPWDSDPYSRGTWLVHRPETTRSETDAVAEPHGRLVPCGSDVSRQGASYLEGAVRSGHAAAATTLHLLAEPGRGSRG
jgi:monoamine oxidase